MHHKHHRLRRLKPSWNPDQARSQSAAFRHHCGSSCVPKVATTNGQGCAICWPAIASVWAGGPLADRRAQQTSDPALDQSTWSTPKPRDTQWPATSARAASTEFGPNRNGSKAESPRLLLSCAHPSTHAHSTSTQIARVASVVQRRFFGRAEGVVLGMDEVAVAGWHRQFGSTLGAQHSRCWHHDYPSLLLRQFGPAILSHDITLR